MKSFKPDLFYALGLAASFVLGMWFGSEPRLSTASSPSPVARPAAETPPTSSQPATPSPAGQLALPAAASQTPPPSAYTLIATDPRAAMDEAMKQPDATRLATMQNVMAVWLRNDRLAAAEWMTERRGLREFEPLSAQVSDAFFPDDTEMSAMFSFDLTDEKLRDVRVNRLVAYWKSGAHLKFDNSPWEVDGPGTAPAQSATKTPDPETDTAAQETPVAENNPTNESEPKS